MRVLTVILFAAALACGADSHAFAWDGGDEEVPIVDDTIISKAQTGKPPAGATAPDTNKCVWIPIGALTTTAGVPIEEKKVVNGITYVLFLRTCPNSAQGVWVAQVTAEELGRQLVDEAKAKLPKPSFGSAPGAATGIVNVDTWLWTDPAQFVEVKTRMAWVPTPTGAVWAQATATPTELVFTPGEPDSEAVSCAGPGEVWAPEYGDDAASGCMYRYLHSSQISATGTFTSTMSIVWSISWNSNEGTRVTPEYRTTTTQAVTVKEVQALVTG